MLRGRTCPALRGWSSFPNIMKRGCPGPPCSHHFLGRAAGFGTAGGGGGNKGIQFPNPRSKSPSQRKTENTSDLSSTTTKGKAKDNVEPADDYESIPTYPPRPNFKDFKNILRPDSQVVVFDGCPEDPYKPSSTPLYQTATFRAPTADSFGEYDYTRSGNPTRTALEKHAALFYVLISIVVMCMMCGHVHVIF